MSRHVLLVEDEPSIADTISYALQTEGFHCSWCATGKEALEILGGKAVDLIVLDVGLPDGNGFELCKTIRKSSTTPIIFLTARIDEIDRVVGLEIGGDDYMVKPFSPRELAARIKAVLRRVAAPAAVAPKTPFRVDGDRRRIHFRGHPLALSRYEYRLLTVLIQRPGWVFSRERLMELAWDEPESSMDRTVDAHIKSIRAKLRAVDPHDDPIQTHRGMGYSLKETSS